MSKEVRSKTPMLEFQKVFSLHFLCKPRSSARATNPLNYVPNSPLDRFQGAQAKDGLGLLIFSSQLPKHIDPFKLFCWFSVSCPLGLGGPCPPLPGSDSGSLILSLGVCSPFFGSAAHPASAEPRLVIIGSRTDYGKGGR